MTTRVLNRAYDQAMKPYGINGGQFSLLVAIHGHQQGTIGQLARALEMDRTTITAALKPLERDGLISSDPDPADHRSRIVWLTERGSQLLATAHQSWQEVNAKFSQMLESDLDLFFGALRRLGQ